MGHTPPLGEYLHKDSLLHKESGGKDRSLPILQIREWRQRVVMDHESLDFFYLLSSLCILMK